MKISWHQLFLLTTITFFLSLSLTAALRSTQAQERAQSEATISNRDDSGEINDQGWLRKYKLYTPSSYNRDRPMPLVLVFHGHEGTGDSIADVTRFNDVAEQEGFIVVYPDGIDHNWHLRGSSSRKVDDVSFVTALIDHLKQIRSIDSHRIYATGFSKGAIFAQDLACELPEQFAAVASVAGSLPVRLPAQCQPKTPVSMLMINGTNDLAVHYEGDDNNQRGALISIPEAINVWQTLDECPSPAQVQQLPASNPSSRFKVKVTHYSGCRDGSEVKLMAIQNGGHLWPGGVSQDANVNKFNADLGFNASQTIWDFFENHFLP